MFLDADNKDIVLPMVDIGPGQLFFSISLVHPGSKLLSSLKNNRQPWECAEMKEQDKACQKLLSP